MGIRFPRSGILYLNTRRQLALLLALAIFGIIYFLLVALDSERLQSLPSAPYKLPSYIDSKGEYRNPYAKEHGEGLVGTESTDPQGPALPGQLSDQDFASAHKLRFHPSTEASRFSSKDAWRPFETYDSSIEELILDSPLLRPHILPLDQYRSKTEYLRQPLIADYAPHSEKMFLMMKEGSNVLWNRIPVHLLTTFTKVPYFSIYADGPDSIGGYEVVDILANVSRRTLHLKDFELYRKLVEVRNYNTGIDPAELNLDGGWDLDKYKNIPMLAHALKVAPPSVDWFVFMDGDTYLFMDSLMEYLHKLDPKKPLYLGSSALYKDLDFAHGGSGVVLSRAALQKTLGDHPEWVQEMELITSDNCCGDYMVALMLEKAGIPLSRGSKYPTVEDKFQGQPHWNLAATSSTWCQKILSFHHLTPHDVEVLWEYERLLGPKNRRDITYSDIYRDFVAPHIEEYMENWNNMADNTEFTEAKDIEEEEKLSEENKKKEATEKAKEKAEEYRKLLEDQSKVEPLTEEELKALKQLKSSEDETETESSNNKRSILNTLGGKETDKEDVRGKKTLPEVKPWMSAIACEAACKTKSDCLSWRYLPEQKYCGVDSAVKLGRPVLSGLEFNYVENEKNLDRTNAVSGYMISRIRDLRRKSKCDPLYYDKAQRKDDVYLNEIEKGNVIDRYEGWYRRMQMKEIEAARMRKEALDKKWDEEHS